MANYIFQCTECNGEGHIEVIVGLDDIEWTRCDECDGAGDHQVDDEEAAEKMKWGEQPLKGPF